MLQGIKRNWIELVVFGAIFAVLIICTAPNSTWINTDSDGIHDLYAAKNLFLAHKTSMPLYLLVGHLFVQLPFGTEFWRLALFSVLATMGTCAFIYLIIRHHLKDNPKARIYAIVGVLIFGGSALVISQSTIVETYALVTMLMTGAYYFCIKERWNMCSLMLGLGLAVHLLAGIAILVMFIFKEELRYWQCYLIVTGCLLFYFYLPLSAMIRPEQPDMWGNMTSGDIGKDLYGTFNSLFGSLAIYDFPKRLLDATGLLLASLGLAGVAIIHYFKKAKKLLKNVLFWLFILPIIMYVIGLPNQTYVYVMPSIAIGAVIAIIGLARMEKKWLWSVFGVAIVLLGFNANYFDIGRTLDPELSATKYYNEELNKVPDGQILMPYYGWEWAAIYSYNKEYDRQIIPVCIDVLISPVYQEQLKAQGIKFEDNNAQSRIMRQNYIAASIAELNDNVWTTRPTTPRTYGSEIFLVEDSSVLQKIPTEPPAVWHWKPSNPYDIITGAIEVQEWNFITLSNRNMLFFIVVIGFSLFTYWLLVQAWNKKKKEKSDEIITKKT